MAVLATGVLMVALLVPARSRAWIRSNVLSRVFAVERYVDRMLLEGKPAPELDGASLAALRGRPVLLFFWAHWCPACKKEAPIIAAIQQQFAGDGLAVVAPTQRYGYTATAESASPQEEDSYIQDVWKERYSALAQADVPVVISAANWKSYRSGTTPTIVLIDRAGAVRLYHPGVMSEADLIAQVRNVLK